MRMWDCVKLASEQLIRRRLRAFLCALSVGVGVAAMLLIAALGACGQQQVKAALDRIGLRGLAVYMAQQEDGKKLTAVQADAIADCFAQVRHAMPIKAQSASYSVGQQNGSAVLLGVDEQLGAVMRLTVASGQLISAQQANSGERVAVVDTTLAQELFGRENIVGKRLRVTMNNAEDYYRVIGVIEPQTAALGAGVQALAPTLIYVPYACLATQTDSTDQIFVQCAAGTDSAEMGKQLERFLYDRERVAGTLKVQDMSGTLQQAQGLVRTMTVVFLAVAAISFAVAMLGVASGMLSATHEKTAEIGMFMAIGARRKDIVQLFLCQAALICLIGGIGGMAFTGILLRIAAWHWGIVLSMPIGFTLLLPMVSVLCGLLAGFAPAVWAARLHPVDAMRK